MTKARSKAQKRAQKRKGIRTQYPEWQREAVRQEPRECATATVISARVRQTGMAADTVRAEMFGDICGKAIGMGAKSAEEARDLWQTFKALTGDAETYYRRRIGRPLFPNVSRIEFLPDRMETRADDRPDLRSADEKEADARNRWTMWRGRLDRMTKAEATAIDIAMRHIVILFHMGRLTRHGLRFVEAMRTLDRIARAG